MDSLSDFVIYHKAIIIKIMMPYTKIVHKQNRDLEIGLQSCTQLILVKDPTVIQQRKDSLFNK